MLQHSGRRKLIFFCPVMGKYLECYWISQYKPLRTLLELAAKSTLSTLEWGLNNLFPDPSNIELSQLVQTTGLSFVPYLVHFYKSITSRKILTWTATLKRAYGPLCPWAKELIPCISRGSIILNRCTYFTATKNSLRFFDVALIRFRQKFS